MIIFLKKSELNRPLNEKYLKFQDYFMYKNFFLVNFFFLVIIHTLFYQLMGYTPEDNSYSIILYHIAVRSAVLKIFVHAMKLKNEVIIF